MTTEIGLPPRVQRVDLHPDGRLVLEFFGPTGRQIRAFDPRQAQRGLFVLDERPPHEEGEKPPSAQKIFREALVPSVLVGEVQDEARGVCSVRFTHKSGREISISLETDGDPPRAVLLSHKGDVARILVATGPRRATDGRNLEKGQVYVPPTMSAQRPAALAPDRAPGGSTRRESDPFINAKAALTRERKRLARLRRALEGDLLRHGDASRLARDGELLKNALSRVQRGAHEVHVDDVDGPRIIVLDRARSAVENMESLFKRARRARHAPEHVQPRIDDIIAREAMLERLFEEVARARHPHPPAETRPLEEREFSNDGVDDESDERAEESPLLARVHAFVAERSSGADKRARPRPRRGERLPYRTFLGAGDVRILVGRSARDNDALTFHIANGNDVWLHTRDAPGSHVVVRTARDRLSPELLQDAAHLALWFSPLRATRRGEVQFTSCKHVKKPGRDAPPGLVHVREERAVHVVIDDQRMTALLAREVRDDERP